VQQIIRMGILFLFSYWIGINAWADDLVPSKTIDSPVWYSQNAQGELQVHLYFFWSKTCPHCHRALPFVTALPNIYPWLQVQTYELTEHPEHVQRYLTMAGQIGEKASSVPAFLFCQQMIVGYDNEQGMGADLQQRLEDCHAKSQVNFSTESATAQADPKSANAKQSKETVLNPAESEQISSSTSSAADNQNNKPAVETQVPQVTQDFQVPVLGKINAEDYSLLTLTALIAGLDAFNPCAFFVLLFLLSLLVHTRKRSRMLLIGGIFIFFSGLIYFLFMATWLNLFLWLQELQKVTLIAGLVAVGIALINIKDFFWFKHGISLSIPEGAKPGLYQQMRGLVISGNSLIPLLLSTVVLAIVANAYELLCTAGFPMVYTRILTLNELPMQVYYSYLLLYNLIYIIPLLLIVLVFTYTLGSRKLAESEGRALKLMSGLMMLGLGSILLLNPSLLTEIGVTLGVIGGALGISLLLVIWDKRRLSNGH